MALEDAARAVVALWDEGDEASHERMLKCMDACKGPGYARALLDAIATLYYVLPE